jgi:CRISPR system Cascade subunit CasC
MYVELHILQNFAPSNLNRDDTNNPKDCEFGGVRRARISSQCLKRSIRWAPVFRQTTKVENGLRTRWVTKKIYDQLLAAGKTDEEAIDLAQKVAAAYAGKMEKEKDKPMERTAVLIYHSPEEIRLLVDGLLDGKKPEDLAKELVKASKDRTSAPDIALFGRMLANDPKFNLDAACQVAHAISTHRVNMEMDFYTAVDDLNADGEETGAGMMGVTAFNSACFYRYACVNWELLVENLDNDMELAARTLEAFLRASIEAVPSGKQNSSAARNMPSLLLGVVRKEGPAWSLANAFEQPVSAGREGGLVARSAQALEAYWSALERVYGSRGISTYVLPIDPTIQLSDLQQTACTDLESWVASMRGTVQAD